MPFEGMNFGGMGGMGGGMPGGTRSFHYSMGGGENGFNSDPFKVFTEFMRTGGAGTGDDDDFFSQFTGGGRSSRGSRKDSYAGSSMRRRDRSPEVTTVERPLPVTLEELYRGTHKKMKIKRKTFDPRTQKRNVEDKILEMDIKPGYKAGTKMKFKGVGDQEEGGTQDLHFIITEVNTLYAARRTKNANNPAERPPAFQAPGRQPHRYHRIGSQRSPDGLATDDIYYRRQASPSTRWRPYTTGLQRNFPTSRHAKEQGKEQGRTRRHDRGGKDQVSNKSDNGSEESIEGDSMIDEAASDAGVWRSPGKGGLSQANFASLQAGLASE